MKQTAAKLAQQGDILGAATIYEILVTEIFEQSHLYYNEEAVYDDYYEEEGYYPEEEGLEEFVGESPARMSQASFSPPAGEERMP